MKSLAFFPLLILFILTGCSSSEEALPDIPPSELYTQAQSYLKEGSWDSAIERLEALDSRYPFGAYSEQTQLNLIYAYYKSDDLALTLATISRFYRLNPNHPKIDWVLYMKGLAYMAQDRSFMHDLLHMDRSDRDPGPARSAFQIFKQLLEEYPDSLYTKDAQARMYALKNRLANYQLASADFYLRREAWISAIKRCQELQRTYPDTKAAKESLKIMLTAYEQLGLDESIERVQELIELNS